MKYLFITALLFTTQASADWDDDIYAEMEPEDRESWHEVKPMSASTKRALARGLFILGAGAQGYYGGKASVPNYQGGTRCKSVRNWDGSAGWTTTCN